MFHMVQSLFAMLLVFVALPWMAFHYATVWKRGASLTREDEGLLDELHELGRRLDERMGSIERILTAEDPEWRAVAKDPVSMIERDENKDFLRRKQ